MMFLYCKMFLPPLPEALTCKNIGIEENRREGKHNKPDLLRLWKFVF
jgi:hypothetical protein